MAVLVHRWFELTPNQVGEFAQESKQRNKEMKANAAGGLASSGEELAKNLPTVVVGATNKGMKDRMYGGDNLMPIEDSYVHVVAALAGMKHLLYDIQSPGLYGVSASNPHQLTYDIELENSPTSSLGELLDLSELFSEFLGIFCYVLDDFKDPSKIDGFKKIVNFVNYGSKDTPKLEVCKWVYNVAGKSYAKATAVSRELQRLQKTYDGIRIWLKRLTPNTNPNRVSDGEKLKLSTLNKRIKEKPLPSTRNANATEQYIAASLYHWIAEWVQDHYNGKGATISNESTNTVGKGYVPSTLDASLVLPFGVAGTLVADKTPAMFQKILASYFDLTEISHNGWPHALAASKQFKYLIENSYPVAIRKLEMLLVGHALGHLHLEEVEFTPATKRKSVSVETLIEQEGSELAAYRLRSKKRGIIFGFSSPDTLLCPTPNTDDTQWEWLWQEIVEHTDPGADWKTSDTWGYRGGNARRSVATWIKRLIQLEPGNSTLHWAIVISDKGLNDRSFGIAQWLLLKDDTNEKEIPLPVDIDQPPISLPSDILDSATPYDVSNDDDEKTILKEIKGFNRWNIFTRIPVIFLPGQNHEISLIWKEHLDGLQKDGQIFSWGTWRDKDQIWIMMDLEPTVIQIKNIRVIDLEKIQISSCIPLSQNPVPGSNTEKGAEIFPDLPILPEYISLARVPPNKNSAGEILIDQNWDGLSQYNWDEKNRKVTWEVDLIGRDGLTKIEFESDKIADTTSAHWMIWPNFKSPKDDPTPWRAYYLYEDSSTESLEAHVLTQENSGRISEPKKRPLGVDGPCRSVEYKNGHHTGDAPVALCAYDGSKNQYVGIYKIKLDEFAVHDDPNPWKFAVDFGTSHTVAARQSESDTGDNKNIPLHAELTSQKEGMSLHISENWPQDTGNNPKDRKEFLQHLWRPTYNEKEAKKLLRSDLWSLQKNNFGKIANVKEIWEPMTHYALPSWDLDSENDKYVISGFKWEMQSSVFDGNELWLQERYLQMVIEIFVAEIIREKQQFPNEIQFTFTYPLRGVSDGSTDNYQKRIKEKLFPNCAESLGCTLDITKGLSLYSESHAAALGAGFGNPYEVILVADLGGGTLDTFISTRDRYPDESKSRFKKNFADSAKIGVNHLLQIFADKRDQYLPKSAGWVESDETAYINLCAWMRSAGSPKLFGSANTNTKMGNLESFGDPKGGSAARMLIDRYFQLLIDFLARSIVAYVADDICKHLKSGEIYNDIGLFVKLQGNGWRLWYQSDDFNEIHQHILALVIRRANQLWEKTPIENPDVFKRQDLWSEDSSYDDVKTGPILVAVGKDHNPRQVYADCKKYPLSKIKIFQNSGNVEKNWFDPLPFKNIGDGAKPQIMREFDPPLCIDPNSDQSITMIEIELIRAINDTIENPAAAVAGPNTIDVPVGSVIWEQVIKSHKFLKND